MRLSKAEFDAFIDRTLVIDCVQIVLKQQVENKPKTYKGPGTIFQTDTGGLKVKVFHRFKSGSDAFIDFADDFNGSGLEPGQLIADENYFSLIAKDMTGRKWRSKNIMVSGNTSMSASAKVIETSLKSIVFTQRIENRSPKPKRTYWYCIDRIKKVPFNEYRDHEDSRSLTRCKLKILNCTCDILRNRKYDEVTGTIPHKRNTSDFGEVVLQSINIASGSILKPRMKVITNLSNAVTTIYSENTTQIPSKIQEPFPCTTPTDHVNLETFVSRFVSYIKHPNSHLVGYWYRIIKSSADNLENMALVISTCIEGVLKECFINYGLPDDDYLEQVKNAKKLLKKIELGQRVRDRIMASLGGKKSSSAKGALYQLAQDGIISSDLVEIWVSIRNKAAHAAKLQNTDIEVQNILNEYFGCLELFYLLMMSVISYEGQIYHLSKPGWPEGKVCARGANKAEQRSLAT